MNQEELQEAFNKWWEANYVWEAVKFVAEDGYKAGYQQAWSRKGMSLQEQFAFAILAGDESALFAAVDKLIEDGILPDGLKSTITISDMPMPHDRYDTKRGVVVVTGVHAGYSVEPQLRVHYFFEDKNLGRNAYDMTLARFLNWAKRLPKKSNKEKVK
jgi:hypothetical protein